MGLISAAFGISGSRSSTKSSRQLDLTENISRLSQQGKNSLNDLIDLISGKQGIDMIAEAKAKNQGLTKEQAVADSAATVQEIMRSSAEDLFPKLYEASQGAGAYNSTTGQLIADNAQAQAAAKGAAVVQDTIQKYEALANQNLQTAIAGQSSQVEQLMAALNLDAEANVARTLQEKEKGKSTTKAISASMSASGSI